MQQVTSFRELLAMPDNGRFNAVLFGGESKLFFKVATQSVLALLAN